MKNPKYRRIELRPNPKPIENQQLQFYRALELAWLQGGWTEYIDELFYLGTKLKLAEEIDTHLTQGRDPKKLTVVCGMQRPVSVTRFAIAESAHVISFALEGRDIRTLAESAPLLAAHVKDLDYSSHEFAWFNRHTKTVWRGNAQDLFAEAA